MKILVADDDINVRTLVRRLLFKHFSADVAEAADGIDAINLLLGEHFDLLITDLTMPVMGGLETISSIRRSPQLSNVPIVVLTGEPEEEAFKQAQGFGIAGFIVKPFDVQDFRGRLEPIVASLMNRGVYAMQPSRLLLDSSKRVVLVDHSADFVAAIQRLLDRVCRTYAAPHEVAAIKACMDAPPDAVIVGVTSGLLSPVSVAEKLRAVMKDRLVSILGAVPAEEMAGMTDAGVFDHVIERTLEPIALQSSVCAALDSTSRAKLLLHPQSEWLAETLTQDAGWFAQCLGVSADVVEICPTFPTGARWIAGDVEIAGEGGRWIVRVKCSVGPALELAGASARGSIDEVSEHAALRAVGELVGQLASRWAERGLTQALAWRTSPVAASFQPGLGPGPDVDSFRRVQRWAIHRSAPVAVVEFAAADRRTSQP